MGIAKGLRIVGIGGTLRPRSSSGSALLFCLDHAAAQGTITTSFTGPDLVAPLYDPGAGNLPESMTRMIASLRAADGVILASPGYHGGISGAIKNALDYTEEMALDERCYFDGRAVGCIAAAAGWQATGATLLALRGVVHALRGWPTPLGVMLNSSEPLFDEGGACLAQQTKASLSAMTDQVIEFARMRVGHAEAAHLVAAQ
jgi:FMN reductase